MIKKDQARLEEVYPEAQKAKVKEAKQAEAQKALNVMATAGDKLSKEDAKSLTKIIKGANEADEKDDMEKEIAQEVKKQSDAAATKEKLDIAMAKQQKVEAEEKAEDAKQEEAREARKKEADEAAAKAEKSLKDAGKALTDAKNAKIAQGVPAEKLQPNLEARGMFKNLSPDLSYVADKTMAKKSNTTTTNPKPT